MLTHLKPIPFTLIAGIFSLLCLSACERESYTTWNCSSATETKIPMVLRKAQMELKGEKLSYCGSLGDKSFFDAKCPSQTDQSSTVFTPASGALQSTGQDYQCTAL